MAQNLLKATKDFLDITWNDEVTDRKLDGIIARGIAFLNDIAGIELNYEEEGEARRLLLNFCLYSRSGAEDEFETNYKSDLISLRLQSEVKNAKTQQEG